MKKLYNVTLYPALMIALIGLLLCSACKKDYLDDGGIHDAKTPLTTFDYLQQHKYHMFDTLTTIIMHYNLKDEVNNAKTFFAPSDFSINRYMKFQNARVKMTDEQASFTMDSLYARLTVDSIKQYLFANQIRTSDFSDFVVHPTANLGNTTSGIQRLQSTDPAHNQWSGQPVYLLYYVKIRGRQDVPGEAVTPDNPLDISVVCQTTGIETSSGGILHVLANTHTFVTF